MSDDLEIDLDDLQRRMDGALNALKTDFSSLRTGRASASILDTVMVEAYGSQMPLNQCGTVNVPEPRMITVTVWDKDLINAVDKAIRNSGLGINPVDQKIWSDEIQTMTDAAIVNIDKAVDAKQEEIMQV